jgi:hypothetical protein
MALFLCPLRHARFTVGVQGSLRAGRASLIPGSPTLHVRHLAAMAWWSLNCGGQHMNARANTTILDTNSTENQPDVMSTLDLADRMDELLSKAMALSLVTYAEQGETFRRLSDDAQDVYMWALSDMIKDIEKTWKTYFESAPKEWRA